MTNTDIIAAWGDVFASWRFPFAQLPWGKHWRIDRFAVDIKKAERHARGEFAAPRNEGRAHAGLDVFQKHLAPILAIDDGVVLDVQDKFTKPPNGRITDAIVVDHGSFIVRYGETEPGSAVDYKGKPLPKGRTGTSEKPIGEVRRGTILGRVGDVGDQRMLHFEIYYNDAEGNLSNKTNTNYPYIPMTYHRRNFKRRSDLLDPHDYIELMLKNSGMA